MHKCARPIYTPSRHWQLLEVSEPQVVLFFKYLTMHKLTSISELIIILTTSFSSHIFATFDFRRAVTLSFCIVIQGKKHSKHWRMLRSFISSQNVFTDPFIWSSHRYQLLKVRALLSENWGVSKEHIRRVGRVFWRLHRISIREWLLGGLSCPPRIVTWKKKKKRKLGKCLIPAFSEYPSRPLEWAKRN